MEFSESKPIYLQIADHILANIINGVLLPGERILSVRDQAAEIDVNPNTVARTYNFLSDLSIIFNKRGIGYFLTDDALHLANEFQKSRFLTEEIPSIFEKMKLLKIDLALIKDLHSKYTENEKK
jgi:DNA-binding transcriptional regulator YhcF (GntR family)